LRFSKKLRGRCKRAVCRKHSQKQSLLVSLCADQSTGDFLLGERSNGLATRWWHAARHQNSPTESERERGSSPKSERERARVKECARDKATSSRPTNRLFFLHSEPGQQFFRICWQGFNCVWAPCLTLRQFLAHVSCGLLA
jgi:hypothetical protein